MATDFSGSFEEISRLLQDGKAKELIIAVQAVLASGASVSDIFDRGLVAGITIVGEKFKSDEVFVPKVLVAARAMSHAMTALRPYLIKEGMKPIGEAVICTVKGDLHDIGKNLVKMMIESKGIMVNDLGVDCGPEKVVDAIKNSDARVLCLSALLTTTMMYMKEIIDAVKTAGLRDRVKIMVGGAPVFQDFAREIGADAYTEDAVSAAELCHLWLG